MVFDFYMQFSNFPLCCCVLQKTNKQEAMRTSQAFSKSSFLLSIALTIVSLAAFGQSGSHEPTSATDGEVRIHDGKKPKAVFGTKSRKTRPTETEGKSFETAGRFKTEVRRTERHGKPITRPKQRIRHRNWNMAKVFSRHQQSARKESPRGRSRARRPN